MITRDDAVAAAARVAGYIRRTPVVEAEPGALWLKLEFLQHSGSFKARGMFNRILAGDVPAAGVIAASGGNAGGAVAYAAQTLGLPAEVFVPVTTPPVKIEALHRRGATVVQHGNEYAEAYEAATKRAADNGALFCHAYDQIDVCAGQGTLGLELLEQVPDVDTVLIAVGGGGLMAGVAAALEGSARVVAVEPETCPTLHSALAAGAPADVEVSGVAADSLGARRVGTIAYEVAVRTGVHSLLVSDDDIVAARRALWDRYRVLVEHGTAAAYAALLTRAYTPATGERVALVLCGANTDPTRL
ncbi:threonine/serine dehydratase [Phytohabitans aurantiacus]|uniref:Threonine dehydratase n=1 Tax=Phytohabitans aurantiacus TaxID=3016789 RepID=A0ABQ5QTQ9_9ACTN|nr:threonine/serine dehydratase [Phytohabitans aurantiacus]GLH97594.1 threonine dehydratase [Phytohabitans aurantiacus]